MGKYMKKSKITSEVSSAAAHSMALPGVRTRAKTLALRRLHMSSTCYLELRSRRLHKPLQPPIKQPPRPKHFRRETPNSRPSPGDERDRSSVASSGRIDSPCSAAAAPGSESRAGRGDSEELESDEQTERSPFSSNVSAGRFLYRRPTSSMTRRLVQGDSAVPGIPTTQEMEEFFAPTEQEQQRLFTEKYNFDVLTDAPLPGRFEWVRVRP